jgi:hypothetical protein
MPPPAIPSRRLLTELSTDDIMALTRVLVLGEGETQDEHWFEEQARQIECLPKSLLTPKGRLSRAMTKVSEVVSQNPTEKATLCPTHKRLEAHIIRRIFLQVTKEVTVRSAAVASCTNLPTGVSFWLKRLQTINSLWMGPEIYRVAFDAMPWDERPPQIKSGCEACILSVIGGASVMLLDLHVSCLGRQQKSPRAAPALMRFTDGWLKALELNPPDLAIKLMEEIKSVRQARLKAKRKNREQRRSGNLSPSIHSETGSRLGKFEFDFEAGRTEHSEDAENENGDAETIGVYYTERLTESNERAAVSQSAQEMHPAFHGSMIFGHNGTTRPESQARGKSSHSRATLSRAHNTRKQSAGTAEVHDNGPSIFGGYPKYGEFRSISYDQVTAQPKRQNIRDEPPSTPTRPRSQRRQNYAPSFQSSRTANSGGAYGEGPYTSPCAFVPPGTPRVTPVGHVAASRPQSTKGPSYSDRKAMDRLSADRARAYRELTGSDPDPDPEADLNPRGRLRTKNGNKPPAAENNKKSTRQARCSSVDSNDSGETKVTRWSAFDS